MDTKKYWEVQLIRRICKLLVDHKMHALLMNLSYRHVSDNALWHVLRLYHRIMIWSSSSEAIAEHVGSLIRFVEKKHGLGRALGVPALVRATRLRAAGVRGDTGDSSFVMRAMHVHFRKQKQGPLPEQTATQVSLFGHAGSVRRDFEIAQQDASCATQAAPLAHL